MKHYSTRLEQAELGWELASRDLVLQYLPPASYL